MPMIILLLSFLAMQGRQQPVITQAGKDTIQAANQHARDTLWKDYAEDGISIGDEVLNEESDSEGEVILLGENRDVFLNRAAFDFSAGFFRPRGLDGRESSVYLNGVALNSIYDGRPAWHVWSGLADIGRSRLRNYGQRFTSGGLDGLLGGLRISGSPSQLRPGTRFTLSASNRSYHGRIMATHNSTAEKGGMQYVLSLSGRSGGTGYRMGTPYASAGVYFAIEKGWKARHKLVLGGVYSYTERGQAAALSDETVELLGTRYNPYWGWDGNTMRSSRLRVQSEPLTFITYQYKGETTRWRVAAGMQWGEQLRGRLSYYNAPNPDPVYYRNMPSFYYNSPIGVNYLNTTEAIRALKARPQIPWDDLVLANMMASTEGPAFYLETAEERRLFRGYAAADFTYQPSTRFSWEGGINIAGESLEFAERIQDLLGAAYHLDTDPFSQTANDLEGPEIKGPEDPIGYHYQLHAIQLKGWVQVRLRQARWESGAAFGVGKSDFSRRGYFRNARYPQNSLGESEPVSHKYLEGKAFASYRISGNQWIQGFFGYRTTPPMLKDAFVDARENNLRFPAEQEESAIGGSFNLFLRYPRLNGRIGGYYHRMANLRSLRSYFAQSGYGTGFVREVVGGIGTLHRGIEAGLEYLLNPSLTLTIAGAYGAATYSGAPVMWLYYNPAEGRPDGFPAGGITRPGAIGVEGLHLPTGPERAGSLGISYRDPSYWWLDLRCNYLARSYPSLALLRYTDGFKTNPGTGIPHPDAAGPELEEALRQPYLPSYYLFNLSTGKSWLRGRHYISLYLGVNNLLDVVYKTGGYQQGRIANFALLKEDRQSGHPSFGPKFWYGFGRTYYLNVSWSF